MLSIKNLSKSFHTKKILDDVSFDVQPGQVAILLGESGVGKSTILRILNNLDQAETGIILLEKKPIDFKKVGMVFQGFNLFNHLTIEENITLPLIKVANKSATDAKKIAQNILQKFNLTDKKNNYPADLSGGQKQRAALARTLAMNPKVLCLDEPSSALDPMLTTAIAQNIQLLAQQGYIIVIATHDTELLRQIDCTIHLMRDGKIIESATSAELKKETAHTKNIKNFIEGKSHN